MTEVSINKQARLSEHLASPSVATLGNSSELDCTRLSPHFTLGELTKSRHTEIYNIPSHVAIENLKRVCSWLEELRRRYNQRYVYGSFSPPKFFAEQSGKAERGGVPGGVGWSEQGNSEVDQTPSGSPYSGGEHTADYIALSVPPTSCRGASNSQYVRAKGYSHQESSHLSCTFQRG